MAKNKKNKVVALKPANLSPENYIKTQARSLPVYECLVTEQWETAGLCTVLISRQHKTGNLTVGIFLMDMFCLGVKDAGYRFNIPLDEYHALVKSFPESDECEYNLAHNIIYGAIAYADDFELKPQKGFEIVQFLLEEDDDNIPLIELEFGLEGMPVYVIGPYDTDATIKRITATLTRTAGEGNFRVMDEDEFTDEYDDDEFENDFDEDEEIDFDEEQADRNLSLLNLVIKINETYKEFYDWKPGQVLSISPKIGSNYTLVITTADELYDAFDDVAQEAEYSLLKEIVFTDRNFEHAIDNLIIAIDRYPQRAQFYSLLHVVYALSGRPEEAKDLMAVMHRTFPTYLPFRVDYATMLLDAGRTNEFPAVFDNKYDLDDLYPNQTEFNIQWATSFYGCMCRYFALIGDIVSADDYMNVILENKLIEEYGIGLLKEAIFTLCQVKLDAMGSTNKAFDFLE